jgi:N-acetylmuramoyl-L-alanine amidase
MFHWIKSHFRLVLLILLGTVVCLSAACLRRQTDSREVAAEASSATCVILDAGHGGEDGGASTADGVCESGLNLQIVQRLEQLLALFGQPTQLIRDGDYAIYDDGCSTIAEKKVSDLKNRVKLVNETPGALLLSIHQNYFGQSQYDGAQVFYGAADGSQAIAEAMQARFAAALHSGENRKAKAVDSGVYLMNKVRCTAVLVECGFLSNAAESQKLRDDGYQKQLTAVIAGTVLESLTKEGNEPSEV